MRVVLQMTVWWLLVLGLAAGCAGDEALQGVAFEHVTVVDAVDGVRQDQRVVVADGRIVSVAPMSDGGRPVSRIVDGSGRFLIPGLWDMHVHFLYDEALTQSMASLFLRYGITSVRDTGGNLARLNALRGRLRSGDAPAPRVFYSGPLLDGRLVVYDGAEPGQPPLGTSVANPQVARRKVGELEQAGADFIKIYELVTPEVFGALVAAARERDLPIAAHVPLSMVADEAGPRVDSMEHLRNVELACAGDWQALLAQRRERLQTFEGGRGYELRAGLHADQRLPAIAAYDADRCAKVLESLTGTIQVPTLRLNAFAVSRPFERRDWDAALAGLPAGVADQWRSAVAAYQEEQQDPRFAEWSLFLTGRMREAGVPIGAGTDTPITWAVPGYSLHTELALLVRSGLTPMEALHAATVAPAEFFGRTDRMGRVAAGHLADLVLLDADPLADIANTRRIAGVMAAGRWLPAEDTGARVE